jgi:hypothetical protein
MSVSYLDLHLEIDSEDRGIANHNDKRDDLNFPILNFHSSFVTMIFSNGQQSHGGDRKTFEVMTST